MPFATSKIQGGGHGATGRCEDETCLVDSPDLKRLQLLLERGAEPVRGFVREADDHEWRSFSGWLALARELEQARDGDDTERGG